MAMDNPSESVPGLPTFLTLSAPNFVWGNSDAEAFSSALRDAQQECNNWRKNLFRIPFGAAGKSFVCEQARLYKAYAAGAALESIGAAMVMPQLLLQRPHGSSKLKEHISCLERRMKLWKEGKLDELVREVTAIQNRLRTKRRPIGSTNVARDFANLMFGGKIKEALELLSKKGRGRVLLPDELVPDKDGQTSVMSLLKSKHPQAMPLNTTAVDLNSDQPPQIHPVVYDRIDAKLIKGSTLSTSGAAGPSGLDAKDWKCMCTSFKSASDNLCHALSEVAKRLYTVYVDPTGLAPLISCRLIALDKQPGVRPIGIGEIPQRIIAKAVLAALSCDIQSSVGSVQLRGNQIGGCEAAVHAVKEMFKDEGTQDVLLVDATNAFNCLNRNVALQNIQFNCPEIATILINMYQRPLVLMIN